MLEFSDKQIVTSWHTNARPWVKAVQNQEIASRTLATNRAIVQAVTSLTPRRVLDLGCGEGWLARALAERGVKVVGIDVVPELIAEAQRLGGGRFQVCSYGDVVAGRLNADRFDTIVCNFSLLGKDSVEHLLPVRRAMCSPRAMCSSRPFTLSWRAATDPIVTAGGPARGMGSGRSLPIRPPGIFVPWSPGFDSSEIAVSLSWNAASRSSRGPESPLQSSS